MLRHKAINEENFLQQGVPPGDMAIVQDHVRSMIVEGVVGVGPRVQSYGSCSI